MDVKLDWRDYTTPRHKKPDDWVDAVRLIQVVIFFFLLFSTTWLPKSIGTALMVFWFVLLAVAFAGAFNMHSQKEKGFKELRKRRHERERDDHLQVARNRLKG